MHHIRSAKPGKVAGYSEITTGRKRKLGFSPVRHKGSDYQRRNVTWSLKEKE
jgi:hypothetical protein